MENTQERGPAKRRLGRGINALLGAVGDGGADEAEQEESAASAEGEVEQGAAAEQLELGRIDIDLITRNPFQPRKEFADSELNELVESVRQHGILQPLLVRPHDGAYQLIAGERRWLAAQKAGLSAVPCHVKELDDKGVCEAAIEENLKRKDLNALEKAQAFQDYINRFSSTIEDLAKQLSLDRSTVSNMLRLLELPEPVKQALRDEKISNGHARALLPLEEPDQLALCEQVQKESLSVRKTEAAVRAIMKGEETLPFKPKEEAKQKPEASNHILSLQDQLRDHLGAKVEIKLSSKDAGKIIIHFGNNDEFERVIRNVRRAA